MTLEEAAQAVGAEFDPQYAHIRVEGVASLSEAGPNDVSFYNNARYLAALKSSRAGAVIVSRDFSEEAPMPLLRVANPSEAFAVLAAAFAPEPIQFPPGIHPTAVVSPEAEIGEGVSIQAHAVIEAGAKIGARTVIGANCYIGHGTVIGEDVLIYPNVSIRERCRIGSRVILHSGVVVGSDGFGYEFSNGRHKKIPQTGIVQIDDDVEIGANTTIDRARFGRTWIQQGTKIDNLCMIAHNVVIGPHTIICGQVGISGSTKVGAYCTLAGQVGVAGHVELGDQTILCAQTGVTKSLKGGAVYYGAPAVEVHVAKRRLGYYNRLDGLYNKVKALEKRLAEAEKKSAE